MSTSLLNQGNSYETVYNNFKWDIPEEYNIAYDVCDRWVEDKDRVALVYEDAQKKQKIFYFHDIQRYANQLANFFTDLGLKKGDVVTLLLAQDPECAIAHVGCWKAGIISSPCSVLFASDAIKYRLNDCKTKILITDEANYQKVSDIKKDCPNLEHIILTDTSTNVAGNFWKLIENQSARFTNVVTKSEDVAWISYTSGTTGMPKGSVQPHRMMLGHMPSLEFIYDFFPKDGDALWSPADWAWMAGLMDILMPGWFHGCKVGSCNCNEGV